MFGEGVLAFLGFWLSFIEVPGQFVNRQHAWLSWALFDDVDSFGAHISAFYERPVARPSVPVPPVPLVDRFFGRCVRRRVRRDSQLVIFVTEADLRRLAGRGLRSDEEAADAFARWRGGVSPSCRFGTPEVPSVAVDVEGVEVAWRSD